MKFDQIISNLDTAGVINVARDICDRRGIALEDMWSRRRQRFQSHARHEFWAALRALDRVAWSYPRIGDLSGHDHTTVMSGERKHVVRAMRALPVAPTAEVVAVAIATEKVA